MSIETVPGTNLTYYLITFDQNGNERTDDPDGLMSQRVVSILTNEPITDVFIISHGWLGDIPAAKSQYNHWIGAMAGQIADIDKIKQLRPGFKPLLIGLHWPSKPWGVEDWQGGGTSFDPSAPSVVDQWIDDCSTQIANTEAARQALRIIFESALENADPDTLSPEVRAAYLTLNQEAGLGSGGVAADPGADREAFDPDMIFRISKQEPVSFSGFDWGSVLNPLRTLSFWKMKDRARQIGEKAGFKLLTDLQRASSDQVRFHLMGHSFGCIVVSATLAGPGRSGVLPQPVNSVALVQGALSLWSYCSSIDVDKDQPGYFRGVIADRKVSGPIITTQSELDTAVKNMYPLGAGVAKQIDYAPGELPKYGGLGTFGIRGSGLEIEDLKMRSVNESYEFKPSKVYNLESTQYICDTSGGGLGGAHSDIAKPEVAHAVWQAAYSS